MAKRESEKEPDSAATGAWDRFTKALVSRGEADAAALKELRSKLVGQHERILDHVLTLERRDLEERKRELEMLQALRSDAMHAVDRASQLQLSPALGRGKGARPPATSPPAARRGPSEDPGRTVGSYSLIGGEFGDEAVGGKPKSKTV